MLRNYSISPILMSLGLFILASQAQAKSENISLLSSNKNTFYLGFTGGYGATTWSQLVASKDKQSSAMTFSTPIDANDGGALWGFFAGVQLIPAFAIEGSYNHYPKAIVKFDPMSFFTMEHNVVELYTRTETFGLMGKFMINLPHSDKLKAFSSVGAAGVHRYDEIFNHWHITPTFSTGLTYDFTDHVVGEIGFNYTAGFGQSELDPAEDYIPFLYSGFLRLAYRF